MIGAEQGLDQRSTDDSLRYDNAPAVDIVILSRPHTRPNHRVIDAVDGQSGVQIRRHHCIGWPERGDTNRWHTIARAREESKSLGDAPLLMFVDDDVVLATNCVATLVRELEASPALAALAADYEAESHRKDWSGHVAMGACLFRREALAEVPFRGTADQCECQCLCDDLRARGCGITYSRHARATHLKRRQRQINSERRRALDVGAETARKTVAPGVILAAFDRRDVDRFARQFLMSLRRWGNTERVIAVVYGAYPSELARVASLPGVEVIGKPNNGQMVPVRRMTDFAEVCRTLPSETPVAYWDVADVIFQTRLTDLWHKVATNADHVLAVREPNGYPGNAVIPAWSLSITHAGHRQRAFNLLKTNPFLNSGFAAGTAACMQRYFATGAAYRSGPELSGSTDWGDQMCLNLYCHNHPDLWREIESGWNFCVHDRRPGEVVVRPDGIVISRRIGHVPIVHGNARSLRQFSLLV